jgi:hypothetical protein
MVDGGVARGSLTAVRHVPVGLTVTNEWAILAGMKTLTIQLPDPVFQWLDMAARQRQKTPEETAVEALATAAHSAESSSDAPTCFDAMKPLWRSVKGPRDLSQREGLGE